MRYTLLAIAVAVMLTATSIASAHSTRNTAVKQQLKRYYHADGFIKSIGKVAHRTIYSSNPKIRHKWQRTLHRLGNVRADASRKLAALRAPAVTWPRHHALWMCLLRYEGGYWSNQNTGGNGHWGGLQMHPGWGYGTSYHASDDPQSVQEWAAEKAYQASGYSSLFLTQQWGQTIGHCWGYV